ncbi:hypothetical protein FSP39_020959 [Pinctada imbricata]|uniref:Rel homology dimerisation domain-containing protein n=1 Tax=Pinctada imbricata TaxID=66713 RepID=A0AA89BSF0_PINIB|nr:hypothetical protein FSP39_020959 [Pinctada imbricata]
MAGLQSDYWSANKSIKECQSLRLCVEAFYQKDRQSYLLHRITDPLNNAKDGKTFQIHTIRPCAAPCTGIPIESLNDYMLIVLSADSFEPKKGVEVWIVDHTGWREKARNISIIRNVIECEIPPYKESTLESPVGVKLFLRDVNKDMDSNKVNFQYTPTEGVVIDSKKRKVHYDNIPNHIKEEAVAAKHSTNRSSTHGNGVSSTAPSPFSDASNDQAPAGVYSFMVNSPSNGHANLNSNPGTGVDFLVDDIFGLGNLKTENPLPDQIGNVASFSTSFSQNMPQSQVDVQASVVYQGFVQNVQTVPSLQVTQQNSFVPNQIPVTQPQVQSPTFNPNRGKFKTVTCDTTGQTFILDQNNKVILVMGGNGGVEANEIPEYTVSSPEDLSMMLSPQSQNNSPPLQGSTPQLQGNFQPSGPQGMSSAVNPLLVTGAVDIQVTQQQPHIDLNSTSTAMSGNQNFTQSFFLTPSEVANSNFVDFNRLPSRDLQMDGADSLSIQEVVVTTSTTNTKEEFPQELGKVILQGDEESSDSDVHQVSEREDSASNSSSGEGEKESAENNKTSENDDLDNVMNSLSSLEILEREGDNKKSSGDSKKKD